MKSKVSKKRRKGEGLSESYIQVVAMRDMASAEVGIGYLILSKEIIEYSDGTLETNLQRLVRK